MSSARMVGICAAVLLLAVAGAGMAREGSLWRLGPQERGYEEPGGNRARDILDNRFEGRRSADPGRYDQQQPMVGPNGEIMDEAARQQWEKEQRIRGFRQQSREEYGSDVPPGQEDPAGAAELKPELRPEDDPAWQEEQRRRNPLPAGMQQRY